MTVTNMETETIDIFVPTSSGPIQLRLTVQVNRHNMHRLKQDARRQERRVAHNLKCGNARIPPALQAHDIQALIDRAKLEICEHFAAWRHSASPNRADFKAWRDGMLALLAGFQDPARLKFTGLDRADSLASAEPFVPAASVESLQSL